MGVEGRIQVITIDIYIEVSRCLYTVITTSFVRLPLLYLSSWTDGKLTFTMVVFAKTFCVVQND